MNTSVIVVFIAGACIAGVFAYAKARAQTPGNAEAALILRQWIAKSDTFFRI